MKCQGSVLSAPSVCAHVCNVLTFAEHKNKSSRSALNTNDMNCGALERRTSRTSEGSENLKFSWRWPCKGLWIRDAGVIVPIRAPLYRSSADLAKIRRGRRPCMLRAQYTRNTWHKSRRRPPLLLNSHKKQIAMTEHLYRVITTVNTAPVFFPRCRRDATWTFSIPRSESTEVSFAQGTRRVFWKTRILIQNDKCF